MIPSPLHEVWGVPAWTLALLGVLTFGLLAMAYALLYASRSKRSEIRVMQDDIQALDEDLGKAEKRIKTFSDSLVNMQRETALLKPAPPVPPPPPSTAPIPAQGGRHTWRPPSPNGING